VAHKEESEGSRKIKARSNDYWKESLKNVVKSKEGIQKENARLDRKHEAAMKYIKSESDSSRVLRQERERHSKGE
jgi:hypothetical protein